MNIIKNNKSDFGLQNTKNLIHNINDRLNQFKNNLITNYSINSILRVKLNN